MKFQFSIRDLLWLLVVVALILAWRMDRLRVRQWEYMEIQIYDGTKDAQLAKFGAEGWEVCAYHFGNNPPVLFKREKR